MDRLLPKPITSLNKQYYGQIFYVPILAQDSKNRKGQKYNVFPFLFSALLEKNIGNRFRMDESMLPAYRNGPGVLRVKRGISIRFSSSRNVKQQKTTIIKDFGAISFWRSAPFLKIGSVIY